MKALNSLSLLAILLMAGCSSPGKNTPISLHTQNPHYFLFRGKPAVLIGSTEHYGAVLNLDFDYVKYLDELYTSGLNVTRTFSGIYVEPQGAFGIKKNTLAPSRERYICPWLRSSEPGYANGGNKFDLGKWDENYFLRLKDFIAEAGKREIIVELDLFSNFYDTIQWQLSPLYHKNNINGIKSIEDHKEVLSLRHPDILEVQEKMVKKIISELRDFDNLYYEICNEPYFGDTISLREWEEHMTGVVADAEKEYKYKHLISNNVANHKKLVPSPRKHVSVYNFHYAKPPVTVAMNYHLQAVIGDNETGFSGTEDATYRMEAWNFILAGGGLFNHLDYSFTAGNEDGSFIIEEGQPGGGGKALRNQFKILAGLINTLNFIEMKPIPPGRVKVIMGSDVSIQGLEKENSVAALYISGKDTTLAQSVFDIDLSPGSYVLEWIDTKIPGKKSGEAVDHKGGWMTIKTPDFSEDIALRIQIR